jgi:hypothetical protein
LIGTLLAVSGAAEVCIKTLHLAVLGGNMKRLLGAILSLTIAASVIFIADTSISANSLMSTPQVGYIKRKTKKVSHRIKYKSKYAAHKTKQGTNWTAHKTKHGTKKGYYKTKRVTKKTYSTTNDKVSN